MRNFTFGVDCIMLKLILALLQTDPSKNPIAALEAL